MAGYEWQVATLPKWSEKEGPVTFLKNAWKSKQRKVKATLAACPSDE